MHCLGHNSRPSGIVSSCGHRQLFEGMERLNHGVSCGRPEVGGDRVTTVGAAHDQRGNRAVGREFVAHKETLVGAHVGVDGLGNNTPIKRVHTVGGEATQRRGEQRVGDTFAGRPQRTVLAEIGATPGAERGQFLARGGPARRLCFTEDESVCGQINRRLDDTRQGPGAMVGQCLREGGGHTRNGRTFIGRRYARALLVDRRHLVQAVDADDRAVWLPQDDAGASPEPRHARLGHGECKGRGDRRIHRVAPLREYTRADVGGLDRGAGRHTAGGPGDLCGG